MVVSLSMSNMESYIGGIVDAEQRGEIEYFANGAKVPFSIGDVPGLVKPNKRHPMRFVYDDEFSPLTPPYSLAGGVTVKNFRPLDDEAKAFLEFLDSGVGKYEVLVMGPGFGRECREVKEEFVEIDTISKAPFNPRIAVEGGLNDVFTKLNGKINDNDVSTEVRSMIRAALFTSLGFSPELLFEINKTFPDLRLMRVFDKLFVRKQMIANMPEPSIDLQKGKYMFIYECMGIFHYLNGSWLVDGLRQILFSLHEDGIIYFRGINVKCSGFVEAMKRVVGGRKYQITYLPTGVLITRIGHPVLKEHDNRDRGFGNYSSVVV